MDRSAEWIMNWTDLILDSSAMRDAAHKGDLDEVRVRARAIASRANRHGYVTLAVAAAVLVERLAFGGDVHPSVFAPSIEEIARHVDAIGRELC